MNDIRIRSLDKVNTGSAYGTLTLAKETSGMTFASIKGLVNPSRRNFLKIVAASGGILIAGSILNKVSKLSNFSLKDQSASALGSIFTPKAPEGMIKQNSDDLGNFFENFRIVKNDKEYILYNKEGDNILIIDRDA